MSTCSVQLSPHLAISYNLDPRILFVIVAACIVDVHRDKIFSNQPSDSKPSQSSPRPFHVNIGSLGRYISPQRIR
jgi:hypothetical protein